MKQIQEIREAISALMMQRSSLDMDEGTNNNKIEAAEIALDQLEDFFSDEVKLAGVMYTAYCAAVGGVAYDGKPLPSWQEFSVDPVKKKQSDGWVAVAKAMIEPIAP